MSRMVPHLQTLLSLGHLLLGEILPCLQGCLKTCQAHPLYVNVCICAANKHIQQQDEAIKHKSDKADMSLIAPARTLHNGEP